LNQKNQLLVNILVTLVNPELLICVLLVQKTETQHQNAHAHPDTMKTVRNVLNVTTLVFNVNHQLGAQNVMETESWKSVNVSAQPILMKQVKPNVHLVKINVILVTSLVFVHLVELTDLQSPIVSVTVTIMKLKLTKNLFVKFVMLDV